MSTGSVGAWVRRGDGWCKAACGAVAVRGAPGAGGAARAAASLLLLAALGAPAAAALAAGHAAGHAAVLAAVVAVGAPQLLFKVFGIDFKNRKLINSIPT